jgi:hypothetical protein
MGGILGEHDSRIAEHVLRERKGNTVFENRQGENLVCSNPTPSSEMSGRARSRPRMRGCDAGRRRRARSVLAAYPRHGVMRGNHRLTFAR